MVTKVPFHFLSIGVLAYIGFFVRYGRNVDIVPAIKTDHSAIILQLHKIEEGVKGPGFWKMNTSILNDAACIDEVKKTVLRANPHKNQSKSNFFGKA